MIVASCAGQVPAAAAATTHSLDDLVAVAPEIVAIVELLPLAMTGMEAGRAR
jgi:hypothetical protein